MGKLDWEGMTQTKVRSDNDNMENNGVRENRMINNSTKNNGAKGTKKRTGHRLYQSAAFFSMVLCLWGCGTPEEEITPEILDDGFQTEIDSQVSGGISSSVSSTEADGVVSEEFGSTQGADDVDAGYCFVTNGVAVFVDADMDELVAELGESKSVFTAPSCAGEGITYLYSYGSYEIETYPAEDGKNRIAYIVLRDDTVTTAEGIDLSMTKQDVLLIYGESSVEGENKIIYEKNGTKLIFLFDGEDMVSIEYASGVMG